MLQNTIQNSIVLEKLKVFKKVAAICTCCELSLELIDPKLKHGSEVVSQNYRVGQPLVNTSLHNCRIPIVEHDKNSTICKRELHTAKASVVCFESTR